MCVLVISKDKKKKLYGVEGENDLVLFEQSMFWRCYLVNSNENPPFSGPRKT